VTSATSLDAAALRTAFGAFPSGVVSVAATIDGTDIGLAASSFTSVSLDPPLVSVSIARTSATWPILRNAERIGLSVLAAHHDDVCRQLAGPVDQRFDGLDVIRAPSGALLLDEAAATFECTVFEELPAGDHFVVLLELHEVHAVEHASPLIFHRSQFGRLHGHGVEPRRRAIS
jgi:flavin reductase (DIM6/NTAB) family NADH-FMN oxidoreductase RutF